MKKLITQLLLLLTIIVTNLQCSNREVGLKNQEIRFQIIDSITKSPVFKAEVALYQIEQSALIDFFNPVHLLEEKFTNQQGYVKFNLDTLGNYYLRIKYYNFPFSTCSEDIEPLKIDFDKEYIIYCKNPD